METTTFTKNIHGRINSRANNINQCKAFGLSRSKETILASLWHGDVASPKYANLYPYQFRRGMKVFYN